MKSNSIFKYFTFSFLIFPCFGIKAAQDIDSIKLLIQELKYEEVLKITNRNKLNGTASAQVYFYDGLSNKNLYRFFNAIESFNKSLQLDTTIHQNIIEIAICYKSIGENEKAIKYFEIAKKKAPDNKLVNSELANLYFNTDNFEKAKSIFKKLYCSDTTNVFFLRNIARCFDNMDQDDSAVYYYNKFISSGIKDYQTVSRLSNIYIKRKVYEKSLQITNDYLKTDSLNPKINSINAYSYLLLKDYSNANKKFLKCYLAKDSSRFVLKYLGISYFKLDSFEAAKTYLEKAYNLDSTDYQVTNFLGIACATDVYKVLGIYYLNKTVKLLTPDSVYLAAVYFNLGKAYDSYSNSPCKNGFDAFIRASELNPKDTLTSLFIAFKYDGCIKDKDMAIKYYKKFISTRPASKKDKKNNPFVFSYYDTAIKRLEELEKNK